MKGGAERAACEAPGAEKAWNGSWVPLFDTLRQALTPGGSLRKGETANKSGYQDMSDTCCESRPKVHGSTKGEYELYR